MPRVSLPSTRSASNNRLMKTSSKAKKVSEYENDNLFDFCRESKENQNYGGNGSISTSTNKPLRARRRCKSTTPEVISTNETEQSDAGMKQSKSGSKFIAKEYKKVVETVMEKRSDDDDDFRAQNASKTRRAVAVDTRMMLHDMSFEEEAGIRLFLRETAEFLKMCARKCFLPLYFACSGSPLHCEDTVTTEVIASSLPVQLLTGWACPKSSTSEQEAWNAMLKPVIIQHRSNQSKEFKNRSTRDTWHLFVDFVIAIIHEADSSKTSVTPSSPLDISILISDISLFSDVSSNQHLWGLQHFWDEVRKFFENGDVRSITIIIVETGATTSSSAEVDTVSQGCFSSTSKLAIAQSLCNLRSSLASLHQVDSKRNNSRIGQCPMQITLEVIGCNFIEYGSILRRWIQQDWMRKAQRNTIEIEFPEDALDGSSCSIRLDLSFKVIPFALPFMLQLLPMDKRMQVIQVVPNDAVDASLIYGVAMVAEAATDSDYQTFKEMTTLVKQIVKWLIINDVSLVVRSISDNGEGLAHFNNYFLFTAEIPQHSASLMSDAAQIGSNDGRNKACLFRYAASEQILDVGDRDTGNTYFYASVNNDDKHQQEIDQQYYDYIDKSLQLLEKRPLNPLLLPGLSYQQLPLKFSLPTSSSQSSCPSRSRPGRTAKAFKATSDRFTNCHAYAETRTTKSEISSSEVSGIGTSKANQFSRYSFSEFDEDIPCNYTFDDT